MNKVEYYYDKFGDYPKGIILKILLSIHGVRFTDAALDHEDILNANTARYFIFSHDDQKVSAIKNVERIPVFFQILNIDGRKKGPTVQVRTATAKWTPYVFDVIDDEVRLCEQLSPNAPLRPIAQIRFEPRPEYNSKKTSKGKPITDIGSLLFGDFLFCTVNRHCHFWNEGLQCKFCDMNALVKHLREAGQKVTVYKEPEEVVEAVVSASSEKNFKYILLTGGCITKEIHGLEELDWYAKFAEAIRDRFGRRHIIQMQTGALKKEECKRLFYAGVDVHEANIEVWDRALFKWICPGKEKYIGRDEWVKRVIESVEVFGIGNVVPVFVQGVEMAKPYGFKDVDAAVDSTLGGLEYLIKNGVSPRFDVWYLEPGSGFCEPGDEDQREHYPPPVEFFLKTSRGLYDLEREYDMPYPTGYPGRPGYGECIFTQSAQYDWDDSVR